VRSDGIAEDRVEIVVNEMDLRVAAYAVIVVDGSILLSHWTEGRRWTLPGGGLEPGEEPTDAAVREIEEETGFVAGLDELIGVDSIVTPAEKRLHHRERPLQSIRIVYRASVIAGELRNEIGGSSDRAGWFSLDRLATVRRGNLVDAALVMSPTRLSPR
jgi:8-oxo-dGTP pyrophosphatase MutT (NUDIX family)